MKIKVAIMAGIILALTGCKDSPEDLNDKAVARWQAIIDSDYDKAYSFFSPGYKKTESAKSFALKMTNAKIRVDWKEVKFIDKECDTETKCKVGLELLYKYTFPRKSMGEIEVPSKIYENWIYKDGKWVFVPKLDVGNVVQ